MFGEPIALAVLKNRRYAIFFAFIAAAIPFFNWVSAIIVGLVTLAQGAQNGFIIMLWAALPAIVILAVKGVFLPFIHNILLGTFLVWCLACILKARHQWNDVIGVAAIIGVLIVLGMHMAIPHLSDWWVVQMLHAFQRVYGQVSGTLGLSSQTTEAIARVLSPYATGLETGMMLSIAVLELMMARMFQAKLHQLKCWRKEWDNFRIHYIFVVLLGIFSISILSQNSLGKDIWPIFIWPFLFSGFSLIHVWVSRRASLQTRILIYGGMTVMAIVVPVTLSLVICLAVLDSLFNFREKIYS